MKLLALETGTERLSVALLRQDAAGAAQVWEHTGPGGAQASSTLIPALQALLAQAGLALTELDAICFGMGPGSFTGLRTACSVAQGLAYGASARAGRVLPVLPVDSLLAVAETARWQNAPQASALTLMAALDARMDQVYASPCVYAEGCWQTPPEPLLLPPQDLQLDGCQALAGNLFDPYAARLQLPTGLPCWEAWPSAAALLRLAPALIAAGGLVAAQDALPRYVRNKVAQTTQERAAAKAAQAAPAARPAEGTA